MIGFDAIGQSAVGELGGDSADALVFPPTANVTATTSAPIIIGTQIFPAAVAVAVTNTAPAVAAGKSEAPAAVAVTATTTPPLISIGASIHPTSIAVTVTADPALAVSGNVIEANNTVTMNTMYGEIGSSSIGEFAIGEGEAATRTAKVPPLVIISSTPPLVAAGKSRFPPAANVNVTLSRAEIEGRRRKLRVFAIAS